MNNLKIVSLADSEAVAQAAAAHVVMLAQAAIAQHGRFSLALAGGSTPKALYQLLVQPPFREQIAWDKTVLFWSDERFVAPDDPDSNFLLAREALLDQIEIPAANIFPVPTVGGTPEAAAAAYAETISALFEGPPRFDLILLGIGPDGHTASLFPGHPEVAAPPQPLVIAVYDSPKPPPTRISFTLPLINDANVLVLATGAEKADAVRRCLQPQPGEDVPPAGLVRPSGGELVWMIDAAAGRELK